MFSKLRLRLVLVNLSVIVVLFLFLTSGTYFFVQERMAEGKEHLMNRLATAIVAGTFSDLPQASGPGPMVFFIKINAAGDVTQTSAFMPLVGSQVSLLARQTQNTGQSKGSILFDQIEYCYRVTPASDNQGVVILFQDFQFERSLLRTLLIALSTTGLVCMIFSLFGSFFMANKAMVPIHTAWQQQKDFLADASHELRTPLAVIQTNLEIVRDNLEGTVQSQSQWLDNIYEETICMSKLVESLLFLARADSQQQLLSENHFLLNQAIVAAAEPFRPVAANQGIILNLQVIDEIVYFGDEAKLRQVVGILLDNAIRHTPANGKIIVNLEKSQHEILLSIADTGEGIDPEHIEKIFERFYQADSARSRGGTGLGLAIAKWIVESHGGMINVVSTLGKGTVFMVRLPDIK
jgi:signal transduction histidine kinase